ncbi:DUF6461 domain-containing protein [Spongiactinospora sp. 9N601]|uniref:DUF6461 domain-containing protein n=1 Tax=Spongiactinospora sp. 9N601 TaxID=3375149 RepID=UPI003793AE98
MAIQRPDVSWLCGEYAWEYYCFMYIRATPQEVVARLGGHWEDFKPGPFPGDPDRYPGPGERLGVTSLGDWTFVFDPDWLGTDENVVRRLSKGTRLVSQAALGVKGVDYFYWCDDGEIKFCFAADEGYMMEPPAELAATMAQIDRLYPPLALPHDGPAFLLVEHLTGIMPTEQLLKGSTLMWGVVPVPTKS